MDKVQVLIYSLYITGSLFFLAGSIVSLVTAIRK
jgi:hypothetical protein